MAFVTYRAGSGFVGRNPISRNCMSLFILQSFTDRGTELVNRTLPETIIKKKTVAHPKKGHLGINNGREKSIRRSLSGKLIRFV